MATYTTEQLLSTILSVEFYNAKTIDAIVSELSADTLSAAENYVSESISSIQTSLSNYAICSDFANIEDLKTDGSETAHTIIEKINEILAKLKVADGSSPSPSPESGSSVPTYNKYAIVSREHELTDENGDTVYAEGHEWESGYEIMCYDQFLLGFDSEFNPTVLKKKSDCNNCDISISPADISPYNDPSYWEMYGDEENPPNITIHFLDYWGNDPSTAMDYGFYIDPNYSDIGQGSIECTAGDSSYPYLDIEFISREDAEDFYNS